MFFKAAPALCSLLPVNDWTGILKIIVYVFVGYFGGIGIPLALIILGVYMIFS